MEKSKDKKQGSNQNKNNSIYLNCIEFCSNFSYRDIIHLEKKYLIHCDYF